MFPQFVASTDTLYNGSAVTIIWKGCHEKLEVIIIGVLHE